MAEDVAVVKEDPCNPCCQPWKKKCKISVPLVKKLNAVVDDKTKKIKGLEAEILALEKERDHERARADSVKRHKEQESDKCGFLENQVSELKSEILSLQLKNENLVNLQRRISESGKEIDELKELLQKERKMAVDEGKKFDIQRKKDEETRRQLKTLKREVEEARSKLVLEKAKNDEAMKKLKAEKEISKKERERADELLKLSEVNLKKAIDEKNRADNLSHQLDESKKRVDRKKYEDLEKELGKVKKQVKSEMSIANAYKNEAMEEKNRVDRLSCELERNKQKLENFQNEIQDIVSGFKSLDPEESDGSSQLATAEIELLRKQLKFEKARVKHANRVYKMEMTRNQVLQQQVQCIKQEFLQPIQHLYMLEKCLFVDANHREKIGNLEKEEKSEGSPMKNIGRHQKRKRKLIENSHSAGQRWHQKALQKSYSGLTKKKRTSNIDLEIDLKTKLQTLGNEMSEFCRNSLTTEFNANASELMDIRDGVLSNSESESEVSAQDCLKLFVLDDDNDEQWFREAMKKPLSPLSPAFREIHLPIETTDQPVFGRAPKYCVVSSSSIERSSIYRIFHACSEFVFDVSGSCLIERLIKNILLSLQKADGLSSGERGSVLLSLLLEYVPEIAMESSSDLDSHQFMESFSRDWSAAMNDLETKRMFGEFCDVDELLSLLEDFLMNKTVLVYAETVLDLSWSSSEASTDSLITGGLVLASICVSVDRIDFTCEISYHLFSTSKISLSFSLKILHLFAHICGPKYLTLEDFGLEMSVLKSLVVFLESLDSISACAGVCPFSQDVASVDVVVSLLLEKLQSNGFIDILSLVEFVARIMAWGWTFGNIVTPMFRILDSSIPRNLLNAVIAHLGQLGRIGIDAEGYEDPHVGIVRNWLAGFVCKDTFKSYDMSTQFVSVAALMGLVGRPFDEIMNTDNTQDSESTAVVCARNWYSSLPEEEQSSFGSFRSDNCNFDTTTYV